MEKKSASPSELRKAINGKQIELSSKVEYQQQSGANPLIDTVGPKKENNGSFLKNSTYEVMHIAHTLYC